ncbi:hypothetical protein RJ641_036068, partial [Dillenia turbinata]
NEKLTFRIDFPGEGDQYKLTLKIMDKDTFSTDDFVGVENGKSQLHPLKYRVIHNRNYHGETCVGVDFTLTLKRNLRKSMVVGRKAVRTIRL